MKPLPTPSKPKKLVKYITHTDLFKALDEPARRDIEAELEWVYLVERETLFEQGESGNCLYIVVSGQLGVVITQLDGTLSRPDALHPGAIVGEMGLFTGQTPITAIYAIKESNLVKLSKTGFDRLVEKHPQIFVRFSEFMLPRLRQVQLTSAFNKLFGTLSDAALKYLEPELEWLHIYTGDILIRQGDVDNSLYIVISGRLKVVIERPDGSERNLSEVGRGESVGELALLTAEERSATVYAIRDTVVVKLSKASFDQLVERHPQIMRQITPLIVYRLQLIVQRLQTSVDNTPLMSPETTTIAIIPASLNVPLARFATQLATSLSSTLHLSSESFDQRLSKKGAAQTAKDDPTSLTLETWLSEQEGIYNYIVYEVDPHWTAWTKRCIRNADRILILGWANGDPTLGEIETNMQQVASSVPRELVLLHSKGTVRPKETYKWLAERQVKTHHHIRLNHIEDMQRLTRWLTGGAIGLVLSGGVARAFAHIGVIRAIQEAGLPIDLIGGTSLGSIVAAAYALGWDYKTMVHAAETFFSRKRIFDPTLPLVSIANSNKMSNTLQTQFQDVQIEDLWIPYFCVSSNLTKAQQVIHRQGPLWKYLRSSCSLPGVFAPVVENGDLLVDGAMMNNLPIDVMYDLCQGGMVIAVDVSTETDLTEDYNFDVHLSGWKVLWSKLNPFIPEIKAPSLFSVVMRSVQLESVHQRDMNKSLADLYISPPVERFGVGEFEAYEALIEVGYQSARKEIDIWLNKQKELWRERYGQYLLD